MPKLPIFKSHLESARDRAFLTDDELGVVRELLGKIPSGMNRIELAEFPMTFLKSLLEDSKLKQNQRAILALHIHGLADEDLALDDLYDVEVTSPLEFGSTLDMFDRNHPNCELQWNGRWYPVIARARYQEDDMRLARIVYLEILLGFGGSTKTIDWLIDPVIFTDEKNQPRDLSILRVLESVGLRRLRAVPQEYNLRLLNAEHLSASAGQLVWIKSKVLEQKTHFWFRKTLSERPLGSPEVPRRGIVEAELELDSEHDHYLGRSRQVSESLSRLPLVRLFSLDLKSFVYADIDDLETYEYESTALARLVLPAKMKHVLTQLFSTPKEQLFGDLVRGKHGGVVILASGNPGVGKTLTAEIYAEIAERPLYVLEFGELGTTVKEIEENLATIFARVVRWNAVLQFDECEIFLSQRGDDLERSAIVAIFLRMLDYYEGLLFLTTNRPETLDDAIRSRVMLRLEYPDLDGPARSEIWAKMCQAANLRLVDGTYTALAENRLNGRQIRNLVRLARILHPAGEITLEQFQAIVEFGSR